MQGKPLLVKLLEVKENLKLSLEAQGEGDTQGGYLEIKDISNQKFLIFFI